MKKTRKKKVKALDRGTIKDVARVANVSTATVSRTLSLPDQVSESTRKKVLEAISQVNYKPNAMARNLRTQNTRTVILVVRDIANPFYLEIFGGVEEQAHKLGYSVLMGNTRNDPLREQMYLDMVDARQADGIILMTGLLSKDIRDVNSGSWPPMVLALEYVEDMQFPTIKIDNVLASIRVMEYLNSLGHTRIAHISGPVPEVLSSDRLAGYRQALNNMSLKQNDDWVYSGDFSKVSGHLAVRQFLKSDEKPTAIYCANDEMAIGAINELRTQGIQVPDDISVVGFDDITFASEFYPALTTVCQKRSEIGRQAMLTLADILSGKKVSLEPVIMPTELIIRDSSAVVKKEIN